MDLPQELVDEIISLLANHQRTLRTCVQVSKSFAYASQPHIFCHVLLGPPRRNSTFIPALGFQQLLTEAPHIGPLVKELVITTGTNPSWVDSVPFSQLLGALTNLRALSVKGAGLPMRTPWSMLPSNFRAHITSAMQSPKINYISLHNITFHGVEKFLLLTEQESVTRLDLSGIRVHATPGQPLQLGKQTGPKLTSLSLLWAPTQPREDYGLLLHPPSLFHVDQLEVLRVHIRSADEYAELSSFLETAAHLSHLSVWLPFEMPYNQLPNLDITRLQTLEICTKIVDVAHLYDCLVWHANLFTADSSYQLKKLLFHVGGAFAEGDFTLKLPAWLLLDRELVLAKFAMLEKVHVEISAARLLWKAFQDMNPLPLLRERGLLEMERVHNTKQFLR